MGREIKRVALDFDWPLNKVWGGFINPFYEHACPEYGKTCFRGYTSAGMWLESVVRLLMIAGADGAVGEGGRSGIWPHPYLTRFELAPTNEPGGGVIPPTKELGELTKGLAGRPAILLHDACDLYSASKKIILAAGLKEGWGVCPTCKGEGLDPAYKEQREKWEQTPPRAGEGWQVWETVSEGSPVSPVFATKEELIEWLVGNGHSRSAATEFVDTGWVPTMIAGPGGLKVGIDCADVMDKKKTKTGGKSK